MCIADVLIITACNSKPASIKKWSKAEIDRTRDSLKIKVLVAAYAEYNGYTLITKEDSMSNEASKRCYIPNFPVSDYSKKKYSYIRKKSNESD